MANNSADAINNSSPDSRLRVKTLVKFQGKVGIIQKSVWDDVSYSSVITESKDLINGSIIALFMPNTPDEVISNFHIDDIDTSYFTYHPQIEDSAGVTPAYYDLNNDYVIDMFYVTEDGLAYLLRNPDGIDFLVNKKQKLVIDIFAEQSISNAHDLVYNGDTATVNSTTNFDIGSPTFSEWQVTANQIIYLETLSGTIYQDRVIPENNTPDTIYLAKIVTELNDSDKFQVWNIDGTTLKTYNGGSFIALFNPDVTIETIDNAVNNMLNNTDVTVAVANGLIGVFYITQDKAEMFNVLTKNSEYDENTGTNVDKHVIDYTETYLPAGSNPPSATLDYNNRTFTIQAPYSLGQPWVTNPSDPNTAIGTSFTFQFVIPDNGTTNQDTVQDGMPTYVVISTSLLDELALAIQNSYSVTNSITIGDMIDIIKGTYTPPEDMSGGE